MDLFETATKSKSLSTRQRIMRPFDICTAAEPLQPADIGANFSFINHPGACVATLQPNWRFYDHFERYIILVLTG